MRVTGRYSLAHRARLTTSSQSASIVVRAMTVGTTGSSPKAKQLQRRSDSRPRTGCSAPLGRRCLSINRQTHSRQGGQTRENQPHFVTISGCGYCARSRRYERPPHRQMTVSAASRMVVMAPGGQGGGPGPGMPGVPARPPGWRRRGCRRPPRTGCTARSRRSATRPPHQAGPVRSRHEGLLRPTPPVAVAERQRHARGRRRAGRQQRPPPARRVRPLHQQPGRHHQPADRRRP